MPCHATCCNLLVNCRAKCGQLVAASSWRPAWRRMQEVEQLSQAPAASPQFSAAVQFAARPAMASRAELLAALTAETHEDVVTNLLASRDVRIAVPCSLLSKGGGGAGSRVQVSVVRKSREGPAVALDCGKWWRGAPAGVVWMDFRQVRRHRRRNGAHALAAGGHAAVIVRLPHPLPPPCCCAAAAARQR